MANLHIVGDLHQGHEHFSVQSRGNQCAFMSLSAVLTVQNIPIIDWSKTTLNINVLLEGDKMYLKALNSGIIILGLGVEFLSVDDFPKVVNVSCCRSMFSYEIELPMVAENINLPMVLEPFEAQNNTQQPIVVKPVEAQNNSQLSLVVGPC